MPSEIEDIYTLLNIGQAPGYTLKRKLFMYKNGTKQSIEVLKKETIEYKLIGE